MSKEKRGLIQARRLVGDFAPGTDPVTQRDGRVYAPCINISGYDQDYDEVSATQNYTIGSRMAVDERVFHYSFAVAALVHPTTYRLAVSTDQILAVNDMLTPAGALAGATTIQVTIGAFQGGIVAVNEFVNGWAEMWPVAGGAFMHRRIIGNTGTLVGGAITLTLDRPLNIAMGLGSQLTIHPNIYRNVDTAVHAALVGFAPAIGLPPVPVPINNYFWMQTYGPCFISPTGAWPLSVANFYDVYYHSDGCTNSANNEGIAGGGNVSIQRIGHVYGSGAYGSGEVFLELAN